MIDGTPQEYREKVGSCADCGNSPVNHTEAYLSQTLSVWSADLAYRRRSGLLGRLYDLTDRLYAYLEPRLYAGIAALPVSRFVHDPSKARTYRSQVIWEEAGKRGIEMEQMVVFGIPTDIYRAKPRGSWYYFLSIPVPPEKASGRNDWIDDKFILKNILARADVPSPRVFSVSTISAALRAQEEIAGPVVIKPRSGSRGRHTTVNVQKKEEVHMGFQSAQKLCRYVVVEGYLRGGVCRATVVGGKLHGFFQAQPPLVEGDGHSSILELIEVQNAHKPERVQDIVLTDEHVRFLARRGLNASSVIGDGEIVPLTHRTGRLFGGHTRELLGKEHPKLREYVEKAALTLNIPVVGFDLIIEDPEKDPDTQAWGIIEANTLPFIDLHYLPLTGTPSNVAAAVWDLWS